MRWRNPADETEVPLVQLRSGETNLTAEAQRYKTADGSFVLGTTPLI